ncbi:MAG: FixH family protein [Magnetococcus sp. DMHC-1]|nr:FixH family protein [Magnetococcales bacterium]
MSEATDQQHLTQSTRRRWLVAGIFMFAIVLLVNLFLAFFAKRTWNGLTTTQAYEKGLAYNEVLAAQERQDRLGWQGSLEPTTGWIVGQPAVLRFTLTEKDGTPIQSAVVKGSLYRTVHQGNDQTLAFEQEQPGRYKVSVTPPLPGVWEVKLQATTPHGDFRFNQRIQVKPMDATRRP